MQVTIGTFTLAAGGREDVTGFRIDPTREFQPARYLRAGAVKMFDRGNRQLTVVFQVRREHATLIDAQFFIFTHVEKCPTSGTVTIRMSDTSRNQKVVEIPDAVITAAPVSFIGATTIHNYTVVGGLIRINGKQVVWMPDRRAFSGVNL